MSRGSGPPGRAAGAQFDGPGQAVAWLSGELQRGLPDSHTVMVDEARAVGFVNRQEWDVKVWRNLAGGTWSDARERTWVRISFHEGSLWSDFASKTAEAYCMAWDGLAELPATKGKAPAVVRRVLRYLTSLA